MGCNSNTVPLINTSTISSCNNGCKPKDINVVCRQIIIPVGQEILGIQGDNNSSFRTFILPDTTEDGIDLKDKVFSIVVENAKKQQWKQVISDENIEILDNYIKIKWVIGANETAVSGKLDIIIEVEGDNFKWQTYKKQFFIAQSLEDIEHIITPTPRLQIKEVIPTTNVQNVYADEDYDGLKEVTVEGVTNEIDSNIKPENIVKGINILGVEGDYKYIPKLQDKTITKNGIYTADEGYDGLGEVNVETSGVDINDYYFSSAPITAANIINYIKKTPQLDTSDIINMNSMFSGCSQLEEVSQLETGNVSNMQFMFRYCRNLKKIPQLDTSKVTNMAGMFYNCENIEEIPNLDTSNVKNMNTMFFGCAKLKILPQLNTTNVSSMTGMFNNCREIETISKMNGESLTIVKSDAFYNVLKLTTFGGIENLGKAYLSTAIANYENYTFSLSSCTQLTHESLLNVINGLYDIASLGVNPQSLILGSVNLAKLTEEEIAIATTKGWNVS